MDEFNQPVPPPEVDKVRASKLISQGEAFKAFKDSTCGKILKAWLEDKVADTRDRWINADAATAEALRHRAGAYKEMLTFIETQIKTGDVYNDMLKKEALLKEKGPYA